MELIDSLGINAKLLIVQGVGFLILLFVLKKFLFSRILNVVKTRADEVKETYDKTEKDRREAERLKIAYQERLREANKEADRKIQEAVKEARGISDEIIRKSNENAAEIKTKAQTEIEFARRQALADVREYVVNLTILSSSRLIEQSVSEDTAKRLVNNVINEAGGLA